MLYTSLRSNDKLIGSKGVESELREGVKLTSVIRELTPSKISARAIRRAPAGRGQSSCLISCQLSCVSLSHAAPQLLPERSHELSTCVESLTSPISASAMPVDPSAIHSCAFQLLERIQYPKGGER